MVKANGLEINTFAITATEAAKLIGVYLCHSGKLKPFSCGSDTETIDVRSDDLHVQFLAWYSLRNGKYVVNLQSKYVKRVSIMPILLINRIAVVCCGVCSCCNTPNIP